MKPAPLHIVRYFKGEETRLLSKHLQPESAYKVGNRFVNNLRDQLSKELGVTVLVALTEMSTARLLTLTREDHTPLDEGVSITLETQRDPNWDYARYSDPCATDSGYMTTAGMTRTVDPGEEQ